MNDPIIILLRYSARSQRILASFQEAAGPAIFTFIVALIGTLIAHYELRRNVAGPLKTISLEIAAEIDFKRGDYAKGDDTEAGAMSDIIDNLVYAPPNLKPSEDEREPMPYRRNDEDGEAHGSETAVDDAASGDGISAVQSFYTAKGDAAHTDDMATENKDQGM